MADSKQARNFADRVAAEAMSRDQGHLPLNYEGKEGSAAWYRDDADAYQLVVELGGDERALTIASGDEAKQQIAKAVERAIGDLAS